MGEELCSGVSISDITDAGTFFLLSDTANAGAVFPFSSITDARHFFLPMTPLTQGNIFLPETPHTQGHVLTSLQCNTNINTISLHVTISRNILVCATVGLIPFSTK